MNDTEKRSPLREAGEKASDAAANLAETAGILVKRHPLTAVTGVVVIGLAIGLMTKPGRKAGKHTASSAGKLVHHAAEAGLAYASGLIDTLAGTTSSGKDSAESLGSAISATASLVKQKTLFTGGGAATAAKILFRTAGNKGGRALKDMIGGAPH